MPTDLVYALPDWSAVREHSDRRRVAYWQLGNTALSYGTISRTDDGRWKASGCSHPERGRRHIDRKDLGVHPTRRAAELAVEGHAAAMLRAETR